MQCRTCQKEIPQGAAVCPACLAPVTSVPAPSEFVAPQGGAPLPPGNAYHAPYYPYVAPLAPPKKKRKTGLIVGLSILGIVLVLGGCGLACGLSAQGFVYLVNQAGTTGTMQPIETTEARAAYNEVMNLTPKISDTLASQGKDSLFEVDSDETSSCGFQDSSYHASIDHTGYMRNCHLDKFCVNFAVQVEVNLLKGDLAALMFRADEDMNNYYLFQYDAQGTYELIGADNRTDDFAYLASGSAPTRFNADYGKKVLVTLIARNDKFYIYINQQYLTQVTDESFTVGFLALTAVDNQRPTEVAFSNLKVWEL
ncbi:hypothetical protein [Ktedonospora formicarum]|uniref:Uncharacterized protein n=1 Tax=Ktedonospora formicarum TaxID=2778364 RepID=A0A8J3I9V4_9CHLR|nr:hypothetical protein [Ktedonospora formicarum]GHO48154.1 hypothetical protein KSX_63170 [Ktedonospora formicarum]